MVEILTEFDRIRAYRGNVLTRLEYALIRYRSEATIEDVQKFIYERDEGRPVSEYIRDLIAIFNPSDAELDDAASIVQDAWNYLPHRVYGGRSPAEVMIGLEAQKHRRPRRAHRKSSAAKNRI